MNTNDELKNETDNGTKPVLSDGFSYKFVGNFTDTKRNQFKREVTIKHPIFGMAFIKLMSLVDEEDIDCILTSIEMHKGNGEVKIKDKIDYVYSDLCQSFH